MNLNFKVISYKLRARKLNRGMTYAELIVVLSIFAIMSAIAIFNYGDFQANIDIKNLTSEIALQISRAQKAALNGVLPLEGAAPEWKPSYGVYLDTSTENRDQLIYFIDKDLDGYTPIIDDVGPPINITKGNFISAIELCEGEDDSCEPYVNDSISISFVRPNSSAAFDGAYDSVVEDQYIRIIVQSPSEKQGFIKIFPSGRFEVK